MPSGCLRAYIMITLRFVFLDFAISFLGWQLSILSVRTALLGGVMRSIVIL
jgi:hypothetical protein